MAQLAGKDPHDQVALKLIVVRILIVLNLTLATSYIFWRAANTVNWAMWPFSLALLGAELFSFVDTWLFCFGMWRMKVRGESPQAPPDATVDVFITCYNEPVELVRETAEAARDIDYAHRTWILDDGDNLQMRTMADAIGVGYLVRNPAWSGKDRHAKAGNLINALYQTDGQFLLVLDADQVPRPQILDRTLGYFNDPEVAFVQTPQWFKNVAQGDPFGVDAPLFYGPIQQSKDGWNSAFFCGSNAVLRRDALMHIGLKHYAWEMERRVRSALKRADNRLRLARARLARNDITTRKALDDVLDYVKEARTTEGVPLQEVTWKFQRRLEVLSRSLVDQDVQQMWADLAETPGVTPEMLAQLPAVTPLSGKSNSPLTAISEIKKLLTEIDLDRDEEAEPVLPLATISVTEDMATAMRLHASGFRSVYHHEILAVGLAPEDLRSALQQRLRWAQGTMQVFFRENPLWQSGLTFAQRLMYFATMWSYLSGFASVVYLSAPILYLLFGWLPVVDISGEFLLRLVPCLIVNQLLFALIGYGTPTWRGQQYSLALFPLWIKAVVTATGNVFFNRKLGFVVTPKTRQGGVHWELIRAQLVVIALLGFAACYGLIRVAFGLTEDVLPTLVNAAWAFYSILMLSVVISAARWQPPFAPMEKA